jgi:hypothetical protein
MPVISTWILPQITDSKEIYLIFLLSMAAIMELRKNILEVTEEERLRWF